MDGLVFANPLPNKQLRLPEVIALFRYQSGIPGRRLRQRPEKFIEVADKRNVHERLFQECPKLVDSIWS